MSKGLVLITGVNGFVAARTAKYFLDREYSVRGTVRKLSSAQELIDGPFKEYAAKGAFTVVEVPDITIEGAFDEAVKDANAIAHLASPVSFGFKDPKPIIHAAVNGTTTLLESAIRHGGVQLRTVVEMSSIVAALKDNPPATEPYTLTESDWNNAAEALCAELDTETPGPAIYAASKAAAEKAFWKFQVDKKPSFTMTSVLPVFVIGAPLIEPKTSSQVPMTTLPIYNIYSGAANAMQRRPGLGYVVDVYDVAQLIRYSIEHADETEGERYIASGYVDHPQAVADILREEFKHEKGTLERIPEGSPGEGYSKDYQTVENQVGFVDSSKARRLLEGGQWTPYPRSIVDTAKSFAGLV